MKKITLVAVSAISVLLSACNTYTGLFRAEHNGMFYYTQYPCPKYKWFNDSQNPNMLHCFDKNDNFSHTIVPLTPEQVAYYRQRQEDERIARANAMLQLQQSMNNIAQGYQQQAQSYQQATQLMQNMQRNQNWNWNRQNSTSTCQQIGNQIYCRHHNSGW